MTTALHNTGPSGTRNSADVREDLAHALRLDIVGPEPDRYTSAPDDGEYAEERLPVAPSRWYLTGFLVPYEADAKQKEDDEAQEEIALGGGKEDGTGDDDSVPDTASARRVFFPSSLGMSVLVPKGVTTLEARVSWGEYTPEGEERTAEEIGDSGHGMTEASEDGRATASPAPRVWHRKHRSVLVTFKLPSAKAKPARVTIPGSGGPEGGELSLVVAARPVRLPPSSGVPEGTRAVAAFLVNERKPSKDEEKDRAFIFQAGFSLTCQEGFVARPNLRGASSVAEWDERVADLQYHDAVEYATGHGVSVEPAIEDGVCRCARTTWTPRGQVEVVEPAPLPDVELGMEALAIASAEQLGPMLRPIVERYGEWIEERSEHLPDGEARREMVAELLKRADAARKRIASGITLLEQHEDVRRAFQLANSAMAMAARQRAVQAGRAPTPAEADSPTWRPFQLAFLLMALRGVVEPTHADRSIVDLLFFPTGGGKTEAYLGLAATTLVLRRLRTPGPASAGVSVLMRYTLRLLTLDQLARGAALVCALELLREKDEASLGKWPFEIGLWVGRAATPNRMGKKGEGDPECARKRVIAYKTKNSQRTPIPLENCPWCGTKFTQNSFQLLPNEDNPIDLRVTCASRSCAFNGKRPLPILTVDEPIYRRLPCFVIATVDKFAALPWVGSVGAFFGRVQRHDANGFYGPCDPGTGSPLPAPQLPPPDLIIQDELHLISGPLGTVAGLYEAAIDALAEREVNGVKVRPKIVASTATVRRAEAQIRALFGRSQVELFPPASPDRRDSFFARTASADEVSPRLYVGLAAPGRSLKVLMLRSYLALLSAAQRAYDAAGGEKNPNNPADPYMTLVGYFNALRELGGSRRIVEDEVTARVTRYGDRKRVGEAEGLFADRTLRHEVTELTSREPTSKVADAKRRLGLSFKKYERKEAVDVALATNMISVGLDITRLGLMVVLGQPKASAEYIQATSRVGRDSARPGLVVTLLNVHRPRDRSHFERFAAYHSTFYRSVEATSVTPFAPRAVDRALAGVVVGLARQQLAELTPPLGADVIEAHRAKLGLVADLLADRARDHNKEQTDEAEELRQTIKARVHDLLDSWAKIAHELHDHSAKLEYQAEVGKGKALLLDPLDPGLASANSDRRKFRAYRSMRDVEPEVAIWIHGEAELEEV